MKFIIQLVTLLNLCIVLLVHDYNFALRFEETCYNRVTIADLVERPTLELYKLTTMMLRQGVTSSADCGANKRVMVWDKVVMFNPEFAMIDEVRYECKRIDKSVVQHSKFIAVTFLDANFQESRLDIYGRAETCRFIYEHSKFTN